MTTMLCDESSSSLSPYCIEDRIRSISQHSSAHDVESNVTSSCDVLSNELIGCGYYSETFLKFNYH